MRPCLAMLLFVGVAFVLLVVWIDQSPSVAPVKYPEALAQTAASQTPWITRHSPEEAEAFARFKDYWSDLTEDRIRELLPLVYAEKLWFNDTVKTITHRSELMDYMLATAGHVASCRVEVRDIAASEEGYYVRWEMHIVPRNAKPGEIWSSIGMSHIRFNADGHVILHQDYWDAAGGMYEHFPIAGWLIRNIKARL